MNKPAPYYEEKVSHWKYWWKPVLSWFTPATLLLKHVPRQKIITEIFADGSKKTYFYIEWHRLT